MKPPPLTKEQHQLVADHMWIARAAASKLSKRDADYDDLFQEGCLGLVIAVRAWRADGGANFATYATYQVRHRVRRAFQRRQQVEDHILDIQEGALEGVFAAPAGEDPCVRVDAQLVISQIRRAVHASGSKTPHRDTNLFMGAVFGGGIDTQQQEADARGMNRNSVVNVCRRVHPILRQLALEISGEVS